MSYLISRVSSHVLRSRSSINPPVPVCPCDPTDGGDTAAVLAVLVLVFSGVLVSAVWVSLCLLYQSPERVMAMAAWAALRWEASDKICVRAHTHTHTHSQRQCSVLTLCCTYNGPYAAVGAALQR